MTFDSQKLTQYPQLPGVYLMKSVSGAILYVGKANNLRQRLRQYFVPGGDEREMIPFLVSKVVDIETIVVSSETEALLLENRLIKQHKPKYNALLKDDKSYLMLKINRSHPWPMLKLVRYHEKVDQKELYFGPYISALSARATFDLLNRLFPLRQCSDQEFARRTRPCILYDMKRCPAPCVQKCTKEEYGQNVNRTILFLRGQDKEVLGGLYKEMEEASENLAFEKAGEILQLIRQLERLLESQHVERPFGADADALAVFRQGDEVMVSQLVFRDGKMETSRHYDFALIAEDDSELLTSFILQHYQAQELRPKEILLEEAIGTENALEEILHVAFSVPRRGQKKAWLEMAKANAEASFKTRKDAELILQRTLLEMQEKFRLSRYPRRIECFDNSHIAGTEAVSSLVAFTDGKKDSRRYRKYKMKTVDPSDDYGAMYEVLTRRFKRGKEEDDMPDLLIIDGGKGHLNIALKVLAEMNIVSIDVIGLAKQEGRHDKGMTAEQVFLPEMKDPILLRNTSPVLFLLQQIRDEAHRSALQFHKKRRSKKMLQSSLDLIPGIGPTKKNALLRHFGSLKKIVEANEEEWQKVPGISKANVLSLASFKRDRVHKEKKNN